MTALIPVASLARICGRKQSGLGENVSGSLLNLIDNIPNGSGSLSKLIDNIPNVSGSLPNLIDNIPNFIDNIPILIDKFCNLIDNFSDLSDCKTRFITGLGEGMLVEKGQWRRDRRGAINMYVTEVTKDDELDTAATGFATACVLNGTGLHLTLPENGEITNAAADFHTKLQAVYAAKLALHNAIQAKDAQKAATRGVIAKWAKTFRADPTISDALLAAVNVAPHSPSRVKPAAATPSGLVGTIDGAGAVRLAWLRGTNKYPTTFIVEKQSAPDGNWVLCGTTTRLEFETTTTVGDYAAYRVTAMRRGTVSAPSTPFGFYFTTPALHLAA